MSDNRNQKKAEYRVDENVEMVEIEETHNVGSQENDYDNFVIKNILEDKDADIEIEEESKTNQLKDFQIETLLEIIENHINHEEHNVEALIVRIKDA
mmetsp:Transcript_2210/g.2861  ORF Transcript_2210/g.2861 Transcript_2210/m.2861 type:complete len:97 (+) Transcript_2210:25-315(+)